MTIIYSKGGKSVTTERHFLLRANARQNPNEHAPMLIGAHLDAGWYKFTPLPDNVSAPTYCRGSVYVRVKA